ncbi:cysteine-rich CWC family protein [Prevotella sp. 10(H)]|uniref:cysteine-rich CWC family protein n=1 Tax=Prevotella sp. 10(H) TaxID=1158294 RepID=UPI0004A744F4|nr:cysteine-rich CWC family protein [Prevotella sp. 10(H)]
MEKICGKCAAVFVCRQDKVELCHCSKIKLREGIRQYIKENYANCLCSKCLEETNNNFYPLDVNPEFLNKNKINEL